MFRTLRLDVCFARDGGLRRRNIVCHATESRSNIRRKGRRL
jgi:hypothetical protein